jgi:hypothetical protein
VSHDPRLWTPARYIHGHQRCHFCGEHIPPARPGATTGTRGTKAFVNIALGLFECMPCRAEATRAELAQFELRPTQERCQACCYARSSADSPLARPIFGLRPCDGCELGGGRGFDRICPQCAHIEHRAHVPLPARAAA